MIYTKVIFCNLKIYEIEKKHTVCKLFKEYYKSHAEQRGGWIMTRTMRISKF